MIRLVPFAPLLLLLACSADLPDQSISSEHFTVYYRANHRPCDGILGELEAHRSALVDWLGTPAPKHIHYYLYENSGDLQENSPCGTRCGGERNDRLEVHTHRPRLDEHELIHVYLQDASKPPLVLREGLAVTLECHLGPIPRPQLTLDELLAQSAPYPDSQYYGAAAYLVRSLLDTYGKERFLEFYLTSDGLSHTELPNEFESFFGQSLDEAWEHSANVDPWRVAACSCPLGSVSAGPETSLDEIHSCGFLSRAVFEITDEPVRVEVTTHRISTVQAASCFGDTWAPSSSGGLFESSRYTDPNKPDSDEELLTKFLYASFDPGRYFVATTDPEPISIKVSKTRAIGPNCAELQADALDLPIDMAFLWRKGEQPYIGFKFSQPSVRLLAGRPSPGESFFPICASCGAPESECHSSFAWPTGETWLGPLTHSIQRSSLELAPAD